MRWCCIVVSLVSVLQSVSLGRSMSFRLWMTLRLIRAGSRSCPVSRFGIQIPWTADHLRLSNRYAIPIKCEVWTDLRLPCIAR